MTESLSIQGVDSHFKARRLTHFNFQVTDLQASHDFYHNVIGFNLAFELSHLESLFYSNGNTNHDLALMSSSGGNGDGGPSRLHHLAFELENELELVEGYRRALEASLEFLFTAAHTVSHGVYVRDPDGVDSEIYADTVKDWRAKTAESLSKPRPRKAWVPGDTTPVRESCYPVDPPLDFVEGAVFRPLRPTSACLVTSDLDTTCAFYREVMGLEVVYDGQDRDFVVLSGSTGDPALSVFTAGPGAKPGVHHYSIEIDPQTDLDVCLRDLRSREIKAEAGPDNRFRPAVFVHDPFNGFLLQMYIMGSSDLTLLDGMSAEQALMVL